MDSGKLVYIMYAISDHDSSQVRVQSVMTHESRTLVLTLPEIATLFTKMVAKYCNL
jgi:hypothetical protein